MAVKPHTIDTCALTYFRIFTHAHAASFKKSVFVKLTFFDFKKYAHSDKNNPIFWKYVQNKGKAGQDTFFDFADSS